MAAFTTAGFMQDGAYRPILRPRRGEMAALTHLTVDEAVRVLPILELDGGTDLLSLIHELPPRTGALAVDFGEIPEPSDPLLAPSLDLAEELADLGVAMLPVLRAYESRGRLAAWPPTAWPPACTCAARFCGFSRMSTRPTRRRPTCSSTGCCAARASRPKRSTC